MLPVKTSDLLGCYAVSCQLFIDVSALLIRPIFKVQIVNEDFHLLANSWIFCAKASRQTYASFILDDRLPKLMSRSSTVIQQLHHEAHIAAACVSCTKQLGYRLTSRDTDGTREEILVDGTCQLNPRCTTVFLSISKPTYLNVISEYRVDVV